MDNIYIYKYHIAWEDGYEDKGTGEGFVFADDFFFLSLSIEANSLWGIKYIAVE